MPKKDNRRSKGTGNIRKRADGRIEVRWIDPLEDDPIKRRKSSCKFKNITEAKRFLKQVQEDIEKRLQLKEHKEHLDMLNPHKSLVSEEDSPSIEDYFSYWLDTFAAPIYKHTTYDSYKTQINTYIIPRIGKKKVSTFQKKDVQKFLSDILKHGSLRDRGPLSPASALKLRNIMTGVFKQAIDDNILLENPTKGTRLPPVGRPDIRIFTREEQAMLGVVLSQYNSQYIFRIGLATGMRIGEILALTKNDIDFNNKTISITKSVSRVNDKYTGEKVFKVDTPKTKTSYRKIQMMQSVAQLLTEQLNLVAEKRQQAGSAWRESGLVFPNDVGDYYTRSGMLCNFKRIQKKAGIVHYGNLHSMRHTFATDALNSGVAPQNLARILGHADAATTLEFYSHFLEPETIEQLENMEQRNLLNNDIEITAELHDDSYIIVKKAISNARRRAKYLGAVESAEYIIKACEDLMTNPDVDLSDDSRVYLYSIMKKHLQNKHELMMKKMPRKKMLGMVVN